MQHIIRNAIRPLVWGLLLPLLVGITAAPVLAEDSLAVEASPVVERLGLKEAAVALRESGDWTAPTKIVVRADAERIAWLQPAAPGVELVSATTLEQAIEAVSGAQGLIGFCSGEILAAGTGLRWVQLP